MIKSKEDILVAGYFAERKFIVAYPWYVWHYIVEIRILSYWQKLLKECQLKGNSFMSGVDCERFMCLFSVNDKGHVFVALSWFIGFGDIWYKWFIVFWLSVFYSNETMFVLKSYHLSFTFDVIERKLCLWVEAMTRRVIEKTFWWMSVAHKFIVADSKKLLLTAKCLWLAENSLWLGENFVVVP